MNELRQVFKNQDFLGRLQRGDLTAVLVEESHPSPPRANLPHCTRSQMVAYYEKRRKVALVHQYLRPDGRLGASGLPDPKRLLVNNLLYIVV